MKFIWNWLNKSVLEFISSVEHKTALSSVKGYKEWVGTLTQSGTDAPEAVVFGNELGYDLVWERDGSGEYFTTLAVTDTVAGVSISNIDDTVTFGAEFDAPKVWVYSYDGGSLDDGFLNNTCVKIIVKNG